MLGLPGVVSWAQVSHACLYAIIVENILDGKEIVAMNGLHVEA